MINEQALSAAYAAYDSDPRVNGPDDIAAFRAGIEAYLAAVAAAPAVGVTVDEAEAKRLLTEYADTVRDHYRSAVDGIGRGDLASPDHRALTKQYLQQRTHLIALLTAQPGTHDDAGQPATEG